MKSLVQIHLGSLDIELLKVSENGGYYTIILIIRKIVLHVFSKRSSEINSDFL